jgi:hypothetical protein
MTRNGREERPLPDPQVQEQGVRREKGERCKTQLIGWKGVTLEGERERDRHTPKKK